MINENDAVKILENYAHKDSELEKLYKDELVRQKIAISVRQIREESSMTLDQFAKRHNIPVSVIFALENPDNDEDLSFILFQFYVTMIRITIEGFKPQVIKFPSRVINRYAASFTKPGRGILIKQHKKENAR